MNKWSKTTLGEICAAGGGSIQTGPFGSQLHASDYVSVGIPVVMPQNIGDNQIVETGIARITEDDSDRLSKHQLKVNDIVYSRRGDVERRAIVKPEQQGWLCGTGCLKVSLGEDPVVDPLFLSYLLGTSKSREWLVRHAVGATMPNINTKILSNIPLALPPISHQRAIAEVLGALDGKISVNAGITETLEASFTAHWNALGLLGTSETVTLGSLVGSLVGGDWGTSEATESSNSEVFCIRGADIANLQRSSLGRMPRRFVKPSSLIRRQLKNGDLVVEMSGGSPTQSTGRAALITDSLIKRVGLPITSSNFCKIVRPLHSENSFFLYGQLRSDWHKGEFFPFENGSTGIKNLAFSDYCSTKVVALPPAVELEKFNALAHSHFEGMQSMGLESARLAEMRDVLLPQLMSGKLRVKDAEAIVESVL